MIIILIKSLITFYQYYYQIISSKTLIKLKSIQYFLIVSFSILSVCYLWNDDKMVYLGYDNLKFSACFFMFGSALFEEVMCRFFLLTYLCSKFHKLWAILLNSLIFSLLHNMPNVPNVALVGYFLGGIIYSIIYLKHIIGNPYSKKSFYALLFPTMAHFSWNFTQSMFLGLPLGGNDFNSALFKTTLLGSNDYTGGTYGFEGGYLQILARLIILMFLLIFFWYEKLKSTNSFSRSHQLKTGV